jgi:hypothetical protein
LFGAKFTTFITRGRDSLAEAGEQYAFVLFTKEGLRKGRLPQDDEGARKAVLAVCNGCQLLSTNKVSHQCATWTNLMPARHAWFAEYMKRIWMDESLISAQPSHHVQAQMSKEDVTCLLPLVPHEWGQARSKLIDSPVWGVEVNKKSDSLAAIIARAQNIGALVLTSREFGTRFIRLGAS